LGGGTVGIVAAVRDETPTGEVESAASAPAADAGMAPRDAALAVIVDAERPGAQVTATAVGVGRIASSSIDAAIPVDAVVTARVAPEARVPPGPPPGPASPSPRVDKPQRVSAVPATPGTLRVIVDPWADVTIIGRREAFTTPGT